jgi:hypothetical protein
MGAGSMIPCARGADDDDDDDDDDDEGRVGFAP